MVKTCEVSSGYVETLSYIKKTGPRPQRTGRSLAEEDMKRAAPPCVVSVEDDKDVYEVIELTLKPLPVQLYHAKTGQEAIDLIFEMDADLIILDIMLPDINGWTVLKEVFSLDAEAKVIVLTAHTGPTHRVIARLQNVAAYLTKPFKPQDLRAKVIEVLDLQNLPN